MIRARRRKERREEEIAEETVSVIQKIWREINSPSVQFTVTSFNRGSELS